MSGPPPAGPSPRPADSPAWRGLHIGEELLVSLSLLVMVLLPLLEIALRRLFGVGIPGSIPFVQHLMLAVGFLGGALAAREGRMLALATGTFLPEGRVRQTAEIVAATVSACVSAMLFRGAVSLVQLERESGSLIALGIPIWVAQLALPATFALVAFRLAWRASPTWAGRALPFLGLALGLWLGGEGISIPSVPMGLGVAIILAAAALGAPIFVLLGGLAAFLFLKADVRPTAILVETYQLAVNPTLPAIPLFTLAGFLLAEGKASERLLRVFKAAFGWLPGGTAVVCAALSAFFTVFTGGSGVTILALGGLLLPALLKDGYRERFSLGLLTASGSLGLLLPPALPLILYGIVAEVPIERLFVGGILPGILLVSMVAAWGIREGLRVGTGRTAFDLRELGAALWHAKWEVALPIIILVMIFGGHATLVESAALAALYAFVAQIFINRDLSLSHDFRRVFTECVMTIGGVIVILGVAVGFTSYLIDADVPARLLEWTQRHVESRAVFLLGLNLFLLVVGCLMDIYSATFVVAPLIVPLGQAFGVNPIHLGIIFIANLELGYLTPPVGLNLFLSSYRFKKPLLEVTRASLPMLGILGIGVLLITYVPWLTTALLGWME